MDKLLNGSHSSAQTLSFQVAKRVKINFVVGKHARCPFEILDQMVPLPSTDWGEEVEQKLINIS
jgi:hypothetical protein